MPATITENFESRPFTVGKNSSRELVYSISGTADEAEVQSLLEATAPPVYGGLELDSLSAEPLQVDSATGQGLWRGSARYQTPESGDEYTFDTGGGTVKLTQSLETIQSYAPAGFTAPDFQGAIGVSEDRIEGVNVTSPQFVFSETHQFPDAFVSAAYKLILFDLTGTVNDSAFKGLAAGECLFQGASGSKRGDENWVITYKFIGAPNVVDQVIGDIEGIAKKGWEYLWVRYAEFEDATARSLVKRPIACYVEAVYPTADFSSLGIGT